MRELICINCPLGCHLSVDDNDLSNIKVTGNTCPRGKSYAEKEVTNPTRIVTSTVRVEGGERPLVSVKTKEDIPKDKIFTCMQEINAIIAKAPIEIGDVVLENVAGTGIPVVATKAAAAR